MTVTDKDSNGLKLEYTDEPCRIHDGFMYHGMWEPATYDTVDTIDWINPDILPCASQWFVSGDLVCYCPCDNGDVNREPLVPLIRSRQLLDAMYKAMRSCLSVGVDQVLLIPVTPVCVRIMTSLHVLKGDVRTLSTPTSS